MLLAGASISMFGYLGGMTLADAAHGVRAGARSLPARCARPHPSRPSIAADRHRCAVAILTLALALSGTFERLAILANVSALALYFGCALAAWKLRRLGIEGEGASFRVPRGPLPWRRASVAVPWLACGVIVWLLTGLTRGEWLGFGVCLAAASLVYAGTRSRASL